MESNSEKPKITQIKTPEAVEISREEVINVLRTEPLYSERATRLYSGWCEQESNKLIEKGKIEEGVNMNSWKNHMWDRIEVQREGGYLQEALHELGQFSDRLLIINPDDEWLGKCGTERERIEAMLHE